MFLFKTTLESSHFNILYLAKHYLAVDKSPKSGAAITVATTVADCTLF